MAPATINVTGFADIAPGSVPAVPGGATPASTLSTPNLRTAVTWADTTSKLGSTSTINLPAGPHYTLSHGELVIKGSSDGPALTLTIQTSGAGTAIIDPAQSSRIFEVNGGSYGGSLKLINLELINGKVTGTSISPGEGGAILNHNVLSIQNSQLINNEADGYGGVGVQLGGAALGGAVFNEGELKISDSTFAGNIAHGGSASIALSSRSSFVRGGNGDAGAIFLAAIGTNPVLITGSTFADNQAHGGDATLSGGEGNAIGGIGRGGAVSQDNGTQGLTIVNTTFSKTLAGTGNQAIGGDGINHGFNGSGTGGNGLGGALFLNAPSAPSGPTGPTGPSAPVINLTNDTIAYNHAVRGTGTGLTGPTGPSGPTGQSGPTGSVRPNQTTGTPGSASGGGIDTIANEVPAIQLLNTLVALNTAADSGPDVNGPVDSKGHNLIGNASDSSGFDAAKKDLFGTTGLNLDTALKSNGGPTQTLALLSGSKAIDHADNSVLTTAPTGLTGPLKFDQRDTGFSRVGGLFVDIGAYEVQKTYVVRYSMCMNTTLSPNAANGVLSGIGPFVPSDLSPKPALTVMLFSNSAPGSLTLRSDGSFTYTPPRYFATRPNQPVSFQFKILIDGKDFGIVFTAYIDVNPRGKFAFRRC